jgi:uncharacterized short protein YbdD (DUF466 family)
MWQRILQLYGQWGMKGAYARYAAHWQVHHPGEPCQSYEEFFKAEMERRWGGGEIRRCC